MKVCKGQSLTKDGNEKKYLKKQNYGKDHALTKGQKVLQHFK